MITEVIYIHPLDSSMNVFRGYILRPVCWCFTIIYASMQASLRASTFIMRRYSGLVFFIFSLHTSVSAQEPFDLTNEDHRLINTTTLHFNICVQQNAAEQLDNHADVRVIAGHAINHCEPQLNDLREKLGSKMDPDSFTGLERHIKNRAIRKLLPRLMYEKSAREQVDNN